MFSCENEETYHQCVGNGVGVCQICRSAVVHVSSFGFHTNKWKSSKRKLSGENLELLKYRHMHIRNTKISKLNVAFLQTRNFFCAYVQWNIPHFWFITFYSPSDFMLTAISWIIQYFLQEGFKQFSNKTDRIIV